MTSIKDRRQQILDEKLKAMGEMGVSKRTPENSPFFDQPLKTEEENSHVAEEGEERKTSESKQDIRRIKEGEFEHYQRRYLTAHSVYVGNGKSGFTIQTSILQMLKDVVRDTRSTVTITAYIENIIIEHLKDNQEMLNKITSQYKRHQTLNL